MQSENGISIYISVDLCKHENGILLLFYIFLSHGNEGEKNRKKGGVGCKKGGCCVLFTSTCAPDVSKQLKLKTKHDK